MKANYFIFLALLIALIGCGDDPKPAPKPIAKPKVEEEKPKVQLNVPEFNADSSYAYIQDQVDFGPRVPNSDESKKCAAYLER